MQRNDIDREGEKKEQQAESKGSEGARSIERACTSDQISHLHRDSGGRFKGIKAEVPGQTCCHYDDHGLSRCPRQGEEQRADNTRHGRWQYHLENRFAAGRPEPAGAFTESFRYGVDSVIRERRNVGNDHDADHHSRREGGFGGSFHVEQQTQAPDEGADSKHGKKTIDNGGDSRECFKDRFKDMSAPAAGIFREINGRKQSRGHGDKHGNQGNHQRSTDYRQGTKMAAGPHLSGVHGHLRTPCMSEEEFQRGDKLEKVDGLHCHRGENGKGGEYHHPCAGREDPAHEFFHCQAGRQGAVNFSQEKSGGKCAEQEGPRPAQPENNGDELFELPAGPDDGGGVVSGGRLVSRGVDNHLSHQFRLFLRKSAQLLRQVVPHEVHGDVVGKKGNKTCENKGRNGETQCRVTAVVPGQRVQFAQPAAADSYPEGAHATELKGDGCEESHEEKYMKAHGAEITVAQGNLVTLPSTR